MKRWPFLPLACLLLVMSAPADPSPGDGIFKVLNQIVIPEIELEDTEFMSALEFLRQQTIEHSPSQPAGVSILYVRSPQVQVDAPPGLPVFDDQVGIKGGRLDSKFATYRARNITLLDAMKDLAPLYGVDFHITSVGIVVTDSGKAPFPNGKAEQGSIYWAYRAKKP